MAHPHTPTPIQTDNACALGICYDTVKQRQSKAMDMRFCWVRDRVRQGQFRVHWRPGSENLVNYVAKHHAPAHHCLIRHQYLQLPPAALAKMFAPCPALAHPSGKVVMIGNCHDGNLSSSVPDASTTSTMGTSTIPVHSQKTALLKPQNRVTSCNAS
jgi:hypothetical protein